MNFCSMTEKLWCSGLVNGSILFTVSFLSACASFVTYYKGRYSRWLHVLWWSVNLFTTAALTAAGNSINASLPNTDPVSQRRLGLCYSRLLWHRPDGFILEFDWTLDVCKSPKWLVLLFIVFLILSWISWWLIRPWRRGRWSINMPPSSRGWVPVVTSSVLFQVQMLIWLIKHQSRIIM